MFVSSASCSLFFINKYSASSLFFVWLIRPIWLFWSCIINDESFKSFCKEFTSIFKLVISLLSFYFYIYCFRITSLRCSCIFKFSEICYLYFSVFYALLWFTISFSTFSDYLSSSFLNSWICYSHFYIKFYALTKF